MSVETSLKCLENYNVYLQNFELNKLKNFEYTCTDVFCHSKTMEPKLLKVAEM